MSRTRPASVKKPPIKKTKRDHWLVTPAKPHYNAPAFTQRQFANEHVGRRHVSQRLP
jgi:hypothetical protein